MEAIAEERLRLAQDPNTPFQVMEGLIPPYWADHKVPPPDEASQKLGEALAAHPNLSPNKLAQLATLFPHGFCHNPALPRLILENSDFVLRLAGQGPKLVGLLRCDAVPATLLTVLRETVRNREIRAEIELHVGLSGEAVGSEWQGELARLLRARTQRLRSVPLQFLLNMIEEGRVPKSLARPGTLGNAFPPLPRPPRPPQSRNAVNPGTADWLLEGIAVIGNWGDCYAVARHPAAAEATLDILAKRHRADKRLMRLVAAHPNTGIDTLRLLAGLGDPVVRRLARRNARSSSQAQDWKEPDYSALLAALLWRKKAPSVLRCLGLMHPECVPGVRMEFVRQGDWLVRLGVVLNPNNPNILNDTLAELARDGNRFVRAVACARLRGETVSLQAIVE